MARRIVTVILLLAYINLIVGCSSTRTERLVKEELQGSEKIVQVVLTNGDEISFDSKGGQYRLNQPTISGRTEDGRVLTVLLEDVQQVRSSRGTALPLDSLDGKEITEVIVKSGRLYTFDDKGGVFDSVSRVIAGRAMDGTRLNVPFNQILEARSATVTSIPPQEIAMDPAMQIAEIVYSRNNLVATFDPDGGRFVAPHPVVEGMTKENKPVTVDMNKILFVRVTKVDVGGIIIATIGTIALVVVAIFLIALATKQSCPFVYSYDGEHYVFDAEPLGGAITRGLSKKDYSRLEYLKPVGGRYKLLVRNEVEETQFVDEMGLVVVDHDAQSQVVVDEKGALHTIKSPVLPVRAWDERGNDLMKFFVRQDNVAWQSHIAADTSFQKNDPRHHLTIQFTKPAGVKHARLVVKAGTAPWGSNMIREMLMLRGDKVDDWYAEVDRGGPALYELARFIESEELYVLKIHVQEGDSLRHRGYIPGGGPLITENRVVPLDLSAVEGDTVTIRLNPPISYWSIDYLALEYMEYAPPVSADAPMVSAVDEHGNDISTLLKKMDWKYFEMPKVGNWAKLEFEVPPQRDGTVRDVFLKTAGYYRLHLPKNSPEQTDLIQQLSNTPGAIVDFALNKFLEWRSSMLQAQR